MAASLNFYDSFTHLLGNSTFDFAANTIKIMILSNAYAPNRATHAMRSDLSNEVAGPGYVLGGQVLTGKSVTLDVALHLTKYAADPPNWNPVTFTAGRYAALYRSNGGMASADELIAWVDFGADENKAAAQFLIAWNAGGIFTVNG